MPTGYTNKVQTGEITKFKDYALECSRAFGALISLRDAPSDTPIPDVIEPDKWYYEWLQEAQDELKKFHNASVATLHEQYEDERREFTIKYTEYYAKQDKERANYEAMIEKVKSWDPPTKDHEGLKTFMLDQLQRSIEFDCKGPYYGSFPETFEEWERQRSTDLHMRVSSLIEDWYKEQDRCAERTAWIQALKASIENYDE